MQYSWFGLGRAWSIEHKNMASLKLSYDHDGHDWPWNFTASISGLNRID